MGLGALSGCTEVLCSSIRTGVVRLEPVGPSTDSDESGEELASRECVVEASFGRAMHVRSLQPITGGGLVRTIDPPSWADEAGDEAAELKHLAPVLYVRRADLAICELVDPEALDEAGAGSGAGAEDRQIAVMSTEFACAAATIADPVRACYTG